MNLIEIVNEIAHKAHEGQTRNDGKTPYITHPIAVKNYVIKVFAQYDIETKIIEGTMSNLIYLALNKDNKHGLNLGELREMTQAVALAHDSKEDNEKITDNTFIDEFQQNCISKFKTVIFLEAINAITKGMSHRYYLDYILEIKKNPISRIVKVLDITHNITPNLNINRIDKYKLARYILLN